MKTITNEKDFFIENFAYRKNILNWIPLEDNKTVLILGSQYGILTECFRNCFIYCIEEDKEKNEVNINKYQNTKIYEYNSCEFIEKFNNVVDYIVLDGYLDDKNNKKEILVKCQSILNDNGQMFILSNNKLGLRYFSGAKEGLKREFGHLIEKNNLYTKKEWEKLLTELGLKYQFFYPFPNYKFPEYIFKNTPKINEINSSISSFDDLRYNYFNESDAFHEIIKSGYFEEFSNSFLIIVNKLINDIEYVKFACERKQEYQIFTTIKRSNKEKYVEKVPINKSGYEHMKIINKYYEKFNEFNNNKKIKYCPVKLENNHLIFDFINGTSLENMLYYDVKNNNMQGIYKKINIIKEIINTGEIIPFFEDDQFIKMFGNLDYSIIRGSNSHYFNNIDLIFENVLVNDYYNVIDYEWVFECVIPETFILFRTIFHSPSLSKLDKDTLNKLYVDYDITEEMQDIYLKMEINFQKYVSDFKLLDIYNNFNCHTLRVINEKNRKIVNKIIQNNISYDYTAFDTNEVDIQFDIDDQDAVFCVDQKAIMKIDKIVIDDKIAKFTTNADIVINNDYYFLNPPEIKISNNFGKKLEIHVIYYYYANDCINDIIRLLEDNKKLNQRLTKLRKHPYVRLIEKIGG